MLKIFSFVLVLLLGVFMFIYGGYDDSPGAQLLGVVIFAGGAIPLFKSIRKKS